MLGLSPLSAAALSALLLADAVTGTGVATSGPSTVAGAGVSGSTGTGAPAADAAAASGAGVSGSAGAGAAAAGAATVAGAGVSGSTGAGAAGAGAAAAEGAGASGSEGVGAAATGASTVEGSGVSGSTGVGAAAAQAATAAGAGVSGSTGAGAAVAGESTVAGSDAAPVRLNPNPDRVVTLVGSDRVLSIAGTDRVLTLVGTDRIIELVGASRVTEAGAMATAWGPKDPEDIVDYGIDWTDELAKLADPTATVASAAWTVLGTATDPPLAIDSTDISDDSIYTYARLSGGLAGSTCYVECEATLSSGEILNRKTKLVVKDR